MHNEKGIDNLYFKFFLDVDDFDFGYDEDGFYKDEYYEIQQIEKNRTRVLDVWDELSDETKTEIDFRNILSNEYDVKKEIIANVWDFGGQEIYLNTHQFFLTNNSIYLILWDNRKDTESISFQYWLKTLNDLTNNSHIIIVMNKCETGIKSINEDYFKNKYKNIVDFINISCLTKEGIDLLNIKITETIKKIKSIGDYLPFYWEKIRDEINNIDSNYITYSEFLKICKIKGEIKEIAKSKIVSQYLHDIGDIIHFQNDNALKNLVVINSEWVTKAVYLLFDTIEIQLNKGKFSLNDLEEYWDLEIYPMEKHQELISLMEKFEICFKLSGTKYYIIPDFLDFEKNIENIKKDNFNDDILRFVIEYDSLPSNLFTRLICKLNYLLKKDNFWKSSAYLIKENSIAYIKFLKEEKSILIEVSGTNKGQLLNIISNEIDNINISLKLNEVIDFKQKYGCNCNECIKKEKPYYFYKTHLHKALEKKINTIRCNESIEEIDINNLLNGYKSSNIQFELIYPIFEAIYKMQSIHKSIGKDENDRNTYISSFLERKNIITKDQSLHGKSALGNKLGELDIKITDENQFTISLFEGVNLKSLNLSIIDLHIQKTIRNYNPTHLNIVFMGVFYEGKNFNAFTTKYFNNLNSEIIFNKYNIVSNDDVSKLYNQYGNSIIIIKTIYLNKKINKHLILYHFIIDLSN